MKYHKINALFKRDMEKKNKPLIFGDFVSEETRFLADTSWDWTEKVDGTNIRVSFGSCSPLFAGRTDRAQLHPKLLERLKEMFSGIDLSIFDDPGCVTLFGEGYGGRIQSGGRYRPDENFILFDVNIGGVWLMRDDVIDIANKIGIDCVSIVGTGTILEAIEYVKGRPRSMIDKRPEMEGVVCRPMLGFMDRMGKRIIEKVKVRDFTN